MVGIRGKAKSTCKNTGCNQLNPDAWHKTLLSKGPLVSWFLFHSTPLRLPYVPPTSSPRRYSCCQLRKRTTYGAQQLTGNRNTSSWRANLPARHSVFGSRAICHAPGVTTAVRGDAKGNELLVTKTMRLEGWCRQGKEGNGGGGVSRVIFLWMWHLFTALAGHDLVSATAS